MVGGRRGRGERVDAGDAAQRAVFELRNIALPWKDSVVGGQAIPAARPYLHTIWPIKAALGASQKSLQDPA